MNVARRRPVFSHLLVAFAVLGLSCVPAAGAPPAAEPPRAGATPAPFDPAAYLREGQAAYAYGDYARASERFEAVIERTPATPEGRRALYEAGLAYEAAGKPDLAADRFQRYLAAEPTGAFALPARFRLATAYAKTGQSDRALAALQGVSGADPGLAGYAELQAGLALYEAGDYAAAAAHLQKVVESDLPRIPRVDAMEKLAAASEKREDWAGAVDWYQRILAEAKTDPYKAEMNYNLARAQLKLGNVAAARERLYRVAADFPSTPTAVAAIEDLRAMGAEAISGYLEGLVYYQNDRYDKALAAFDGYLQRNPNGDQVVPALYYRALTLRWLGDPGSAITALRDLVARYPGAPLAADSLWWLGDLLDMQGRYADAEAHYAALLRAYGSSAYAERAAFQMGLDQYRQGKTAQAFETWQMQVRQFPSGDQRAKAWLWIGKLLASAGRSEGAAEAWRTAAGIDPNGYYGLRAASLDRGERGDLPTGAALSERRPVDEAAELRELAAWLGRWTGKSLAPESLTSPGNELRADPNWQRGHSLNLAGLESRARDAFSELLDRYAANPVALTQLAYYFRDQRLYPLSLAAAGKAAALAPETSVLALPRALQRLLYPVYFDDLVTPQAREWGIDPLLVFALLRQESSFNAGAQSGAGARGLAQVMPATGAAIARALGLTSFREEDLLRPDVSVRFGVYYLADQLRSFGGSPAMALAAYNGGGRNVSQWNSGDAAMDPDLFVENIRFRETGVYVRAVMAQYELYKRIYR